MVCVIVAAACWLPPIPLQPLPPPPPLVRTEWQEHGQHLPTSEPVRVPPNRPQTVSPQTGGWGSIVAARFGGHADEALAVIECESGGNPNAVNSRSGASGLFQHLPRYWPDRSAAAGFPGADILDPEANIAVAAWLSDGGTEWTHWECRP